MSAIPTQLRIRLESDPTTTQRIKEDRIDAISCGRCSGHGRIGRQLCDCCRGAGVLVIPVRGRRVYP